MNVPAKIEVQRIADGFLTRIAGRASMWESRVLQAFIDRTIRDGESFDLILDLSDCAYIDSTFLGYLVTMHKRLMDGDHSRLVLAAPSKGCRHSLTCTRLENYLQVQEEAPQPVDGTIVSLPSEPVDEKALAAHVLECHRALAEIPGPNQQFFLQIVARLEQELGG